MYIVGRKLTLVNIWTERVYITSMSRAPSIFIENKSKRTRSSYLFTHLLIAYTNNVKSSQIIIAALV